MSYVKKQADMEAFHGMELLVEYISWVTETSVVTVAEATGRHINELRKYRRAFSQLAHPQVQKAAREARLSLSVVLDLGCAVYPLRKHNDRHKLIAQLCYKLAGLTADQALAVMKDTVRNWAGDTTGRLDVACMHKRVGRDGKRRLVAAFSAPLAARIDTILHRSAERIKKENPKLQYDQAYAQALIQKLTGTAGRDQEQFGPMFMIATDHHFHADGKITTTDGALVDIRDVVDQELAPTGWAAVTGTTEESPVIPLVGALVKVRNRFASAPQRLVAVMETLMCAWPGCDMPASKCQAHHINAHAHGGETAGYNLTMLCKHHNGQNDDNPGQQVNGRIERDPKTGRPGLRRYPGTPLLFNTDPVTAKSITTYTQH